ncbi:NADH-quinone oxidoreductase subunit H, partial [Chloroflexota bacterium]
MPVWTYIVDFFSHLHTDFIDWLEGFGLSSGLVSFIDAIVGIIWLLILIFPVVMLFTLLERKVIGRFQLRPGPNRAGPGSIFLPILALLIHLAKADIDT